MTMSTTCLCKREKGFFFSLENYILYETTNRLTWLRWQRDGIKRIGIKSFQVDRRLDRRSMPLRNYRLMRRFITAYYQFVKRKMENRENQGLQPTFFSKLYRGYAVARYDKTQLLREAMPTAVISYRLQIFQQYAQYFFLQALIRL